MARNIFDQETPSDDPTDIDIMEANGAGMDAFDNGESVHNNPYDNICLREAWHMGWKSAERHRGE